MNVLKWYEVENLTDEFIHSKNEREKQSIVDKLGLRPINHVRFYSILQNKLFDGDRELISEYIGYITNI